jgi:hypothetical protein
VLEGYGHDSAFTTPCVERMTAAFIADPHATVDTRSVADELEPIDF